MPARKPRLRPPWAVTDTLEGKLRDIAFSDDGVNFSLRIISLPVIVAPRHSEPLFLSVHWVTLTLGN